MTDFETLLTTMQASLQTAATSLIEDLTSQARAQLQQLQEEIDKQRAAAMAAVEAKRAELDREIAVMQQHEARQAGRVELDVGGRRFVTSVETLRSKSGTFFDAYFSGRYLMDTSQDGSIFIDRDGEHFGYVLEYLRDGVVGVADRSDARFGDVSLLRALKREFGFYCLELVAERPKQAAAAYVAGGFGDTGGRLSSMER